MPLVADLPTEEGVTMFGKGIAAGGLAILILSVGTVAARASDTKRLVLKPETAAQTMTLQGDTAETVDVHGWYRRGYFWGPRFYGYSFYRPYFGFAYYPRYWWGPSISFGVGPVYSVIRPRAFFYAAPVYSYGITIAAGGLPSSTIIDSSPILPAPPSEQLAPPRLLPNDGTFPYNGGPSQPVPLPRLEPAPMRVPVPTAPLEGRAVSLPGKAKRYTYAAYGDDKVKASSRDDTRRMVGK
jgi:hypothetical protein